MITPSPNNKLHIHRDRLAPFCKRIDGNPFDADSDGMVDQLEILKSSVISPKDKLWFLARVSTLQVNLWAAEAIAQYKKREVFASGSSFIEFNAWIEELHRLASNPEAMSNSPEWSLTNGDNPFQNAIGYACGYSNGRDFDNQAQLWFLAMQNMLKTSMGKEIIPLCIWLAEAAIFGHKINTLVVGTK